MHRLLGEARYFEKCVSRVVIGPLARKLLLARWWRTVHRAYKVSYKERTGRCSVHRMRRMHRIAQNAQNAA